MPHDCGVYTQLLGKLCKQTGDMIELLADFGGGVE